MSRSSAGFGTRGGACRVIRGSTLPETSDASTSAASGALLTTLKGAEVSKIDSFQLANCPLTAESRKSRFRSQAKLLELSLNQPQHHTRLSRSLLPAHHRTRNSAGRIRPGRLPPVSRRAVELLRARARKGLPRCKALPLGVRASRFPRASAQHARRLCSAPAPGFSATACIASRRGRRPSSNGFATVIRKLVVNSKLEPFV